eukprot:3251139-Rhodomonas_salina.1
MPVVCVSPRTQSWGLAWRRAAPSSPAITTTMSVPARAAPARAWRVRCDDDDVSPPRNQIQETAFLVQIVLKKRFLVPCSGGARTGM